MKALLWFLAAFALAAVCGFTLDWEGRVTPALSGLGAVLCLTMGLVEAGVPDHDPWE